MSEPDPPAADPEAQAKALAALSAKVLHAAAKDWHTLIGSAVSFGAPAVEPLPPEGIPLDLPWPLKGAALELTGDLDGRLFALVRSLDAPAFLKPQGDGEPQDVLDAALTYLAEAVAKVVAKGERKMEGRAGPTLEASGPSSLVDAGAPMGGWLGRAAATIGENKDVPVWLLFPSVLGGTLASDFAPEEGAPAGGRGKVLLIDDQYTIRSLLKRILAKEGFKVIEGSSGEEGLLRFRQEKPILVICDVMMPVMNGYETCRKLREMPESKGVPIVMCTAKGQRSDVAEALQAGANDYIVKPFTRETVLAKVNKALGHAS